MPKVLLCLDKFRGSATAAEVCAALAAGIRSVRPELEVVELPIADGGEGTVDALVRVGYDRHDAAVTGPDGHQVTASFATRGRHTVIEMAQASGLHLVADDPCPLDATTRGTGELIRHALDLGYRSVTLTVGGSATTDAGAGMLQALGVRLSAGDSTAIPPGGVGLGELVTLDASGLDPRLHETALRIATDVDNPLLGPRGAAAVFGPQKGASPADVAVLERGLARFAAFVAAATGHDHAGDPGSGAAGGTAFGAIAVLGATPVPGAHFVLGELDVPDQIPGSALVVVGEGSLDEQSLAGKAPIAVAALARERGVPVVAVAGRVALSRDALANAGISRAFAVLDRAVDRADAFENPLPHLVAIGAEVAGLVPA